MLGFLKRILVGDIKPTADEKNRVAAVTEQLNQARGEYRQSVLRVEAGVRALRTWENANRLVRE